MFWDAGVSPAMSAKRETETEESAPAARCGRDARDPGKIART